MGTGSKYCGECGEQLTEGAKFCGECGTATSGLQDKPGGKTKASPQTEQNHSKFTFSTSEAKERSKSTVGTETNSFTIIPLLFWAGAWFVGWLLGLFISNLLHFYYATPLQYTLVAVTGGLIAALLLQLFKITQAKPTATTMSILVGSWIVFVLLPSLIAKTLHDAFGVYVLSANDSFFLWAFAGALLAWITTKQIAKKEAVSSSKSAKIKLAIGWALCGVVPIYLPISFLVVIFVGTSLFIYVKRVK